MYSEEYFLERQIELEIQALQNQRSQIDLRLQALNQNKEALVKQKANGQVKPTETPKPEDPKPE